LAINKLKNIFIKIYIFLRFFINLYEFDCQNK
jgi:hypothetical protein